MNIEDKDIENKIKEYVYKNYRSYKDKTLYVTEHDNHFKVLKHLTGAPLVLGKSILK